MQFGLIFADRIAAILMKREDGTVYLGSGGGGIICAGR